MQLQECTCISLKQAMSTKISLTDKTKRVFTHVICGKHSYYHSTATHKQAQTGTHNHTNTHINTQRGLSSATAAAERKRAFSIQLLRDAACFRMYSKCSVSVCVHGGVWGLLPECNQSRSKGNGPSFSLLSPKTHKHPLLFLHS